MLDVLQRQIDSALRKDLRPVTLCGYQGLATNAISNTSEVGQSVAKRSGTFSLTFFIKGDEAICSLRSMHRSMSVLLPRIMAGEGTCKRVALQFRSNVSSVRFLGGDDSGLKSIPWALDG